MAWCSGAESGEEFGDPGGFVNTGFVWLIRPVPEGDADAPWEAVGVFPGTHLRDEFFWRRQEVNPVEEFGWEVMDFLVPCVPDGENERTDPLALKLEDFPHAEGLGERRESLENVGDVPRCRGSHECGASLGPGTGKGKLCGADITFSTDRECRNTCSENCRCKPRWRRWLRDRTGLGCGSRQHASDSAFREESCRGKGCRKVGGCSRRRGVGRGRIRRTEKERQYRRSDHRK